MSRAFCNQLGLGSGVRAADAVGVDEIRIAMTFLRKGFMAIAVYVRKGRVARWSKPGGGWAYRTAPSIIDTVTQS